MQRPAYKFRQISIISEELCTRFQRNIAYKRVFRIFVSATYGSRDFGMDVMKI